MSRAEGAKKDEERSKDDSEPVEAGEKEEEKLVGEKSQTQIQSITFGDAPVSLKCPFCLQVVRSQIIAKPEFVSIVLGMTIFLVVPNFIMLVIVLAILQFTASRKHRCSLCERELGSDGKFLLYFTDEVYSLSLFSSGLITTKKILITCFLIFFAILIVTLRVTNVEEAHWVSTTWAQYSRDCMSGDSCIEKFEGKSFSNWTGFVMRVSDMRQSGRRYSGHAIYIFLKMEPAVYPANTPDLILTLSSEALYYNLDVVQDLKHGEQIRFNATFHYAQKKSVQIESRHLHAFDLERTGVTNPSIIMYSSKAEDQWIMEHVEDKGALRRVETVQKVKDQGKK